MSRRAPKETDMRKIVLDTETTGFDPAQGDRIIEVAALELMNDLPTGRTYRTLVNPLRPIGIGAQRVHGITDEMVAAAPLFEAIADDLIAFLGDAPLVIHNAPFDVKFLNHEFGLIGKPPLDPTRIIDTVVLARAKFPGAPVSLDALCRRFQIPLAGREKHAALLDCQLLARVYLELIGGRQQSLLGDVVAAAPASPTPGAPAAPAPAGGRRTLARIVPSPEEIARHEAFLDGIPNPIWRRPAV
jgi:DNA polymerase-3 subunit epsilon